MIKNKKKNGDNFISEISGNRISSSTEISITFGRKTLISVASAFVCIVLLIAIGIGLNILDVKAQSAKMDRVLTKAGLEKVEKIDLAQDLRERTVKEVYKNEGIPNYSYNEVWNLDVSKPSGVTVADLKLVTAGALRGLEESFYKAEQDYGINCLFVMAIASIESGNGTICFRPNNMFGFGTSGFSSKAECIDVVARALANNYLSPSGGLYNGKTITDVNKRYASSSTWDEKVCRAMTHYYSVISPSHNEKLKKLK